MMLRARSSTLAVFMIALVVVASPAHAYLQLTTSANGQTVTLRWGTTPVRWFATDRGVPGVTASDFQRAVERGFATWEAVPTAAIRFAFAGFTSAEPFDEDGVSAIGFLSRPELERVLGATGFVVDTITGEIVESDIFFNSSFAWSTAAGGEAGRFDLQSVATHEIGHFLGLGHSALGETELQPGGARRVLASGAVMFPIAFGTANTADRELQADDIAGVSDLYPDGNFRATTGAARGRVRLGGRGLLGAHVVAFNPRTGASIAGFALSNDGDFEIAGLAPGPHVIRVEPLDDADIASFFSVGSIDINFRAAFYERLFIAPAGGVGEHFDVTVQPK